MLSRKDIYFLIPVIAVIVLLLTVPSMNTTPGFTFALEPQYHTQTLDVVATEDQTVELGINETQLNFLGISGMVEGLGEAEIALVDANGEEYLVYKSEDRQNLASITGFTAYKPYFRNACLDTCVLDGTRGPFKLSIDVEEGTTLKIASISYR